MNDDFFALVDTDALKALSGQPSASGAAMLLVDTHGLIRALENGDLLASALSDEAVALVEDCASGGGANSMTCPSLTSCRVCIVNAPTTSSDDRPSPCRSLQSFSLMMDVP